MGKYIFDESNGLWGQRNLRYIREHHKVLDTSLQLNGKLNSCLADIDQQVEAMLSRLVEQMTQRQGLSARIRFAKTNSIFSFAACFCRPQCLVFQYRNLPLSFLRKTLPGFPVIVPCQMVTNWLQYDHSRYQGVIYK